MQKLTLTLTLHSHCCERKWRHCAHCTCPHDMFKELKQMMSEGLEGAKEQVLNRSIINLVEF